MRNYTPELYENLVAGIDDEVLQQFMQDERDFLAAIEQSEARTFVDLGAGYGRIVPFLASIARNVIAIEINPDMYSELEKRSAKLSNVKAIQGDFLRLDELDLHEVRQPEFILLQNSLGTIEDGNAETVVNLANEEASRLNGHVILSLFRCKALAEWGIGMYAQIQDMVGHIDLSKTDLDKGIFVTDTGYTSKWWTDEDIEKIVAGKNVINYWQTDQYTILRFKPRQVDEMVGGDYDGFKR